MNKQLLNQIKNINYDKLKLVVIERRIKCKHLSQSQKYKWQKKNKKTMIIQYENATNVLTHHCTQKHFNQRLLLNPHTVHPCLDHTVSSSESNNTVPMVLRVQYFLVVVLTSSHSSLEAESPASAGLIRQSAHVQMQINEHHIRA